MEIGKILKKLLTDTSVYFTLLTAAYALLHIVVNVNDEEFLFDAVRILLNFVFAGLAALAQWIYRIKSISAPVRVLCHYAILALAFFLCFLLSLSLPAAQVVIGLFAFTVFYAAVMGVIALFTARFRKNARAEVEYKSQFKGKR